MKRATAISWEELRVGVVILIAVAAGVFAMFELGQAANLFTSRYALVAYVKNAKGLAKGAAVTIDGQVAGSIQSIEFLPVSNDTTRNLKITVTIDRRLQPQIRGDSRATLASLGLLGDKVFNISSGTAKYSVLQPGDVVPMATSLDYDQVIQQAGVAVSAMVQLTQDLKSISGTILKGEGTMGQLVTNRSLYDALTGTLQQTNTLLARLQDRHGTLGHLIDDPTLYENLTSAIASIDSLATALSSHNSTLGRLLRDDTLYTHMVSVAVGADSLVKSVESGNGTASKLLRDQQLYDQLLKAVTDLNAVLADVKKDPGRYTKGLVKVF
ncbi:MAG TPA: MlaD family protein [Gemmatimonadaceae bacterium]|nr:MlaD family protein [Gemmatimonadaceae bacterium]